MKHLLALLLVFLMACATGIYSQGYTVIEGKLLSVPITDRSSKRLSFYLKTATGERIIAIAENTENFSLLRSLSNAVGHNKETIFLFCKPADSEWREYVDSVDYEVFGVGYYDNYAERYVTIITTYGSSFGDVMKSQDWASFVTGLMKKGISAAI